MSLCAVQETCDNHKWFQLTYTCRMHPANLSAASDLLYHQYHDSLTWKGDSNGILTSLHLIRHLWMCIICWKWQTFYHPPACPSSNGDSTLTFDGRIALERNFINFSPILFPVTLLPMKCIFVCSGSILDMYVPRFFQKLWNQEQSFLKSVVDHSDLSYSFSCWL